MLVVRASNRLRPPNVTETWTPQGQRVLTVPAEHAAHLDPNINIEPSAAATATTNNNNNRPDTATARMLLSHAHRARHLLADRAVLASVRPMRRAELMQEIQRMNGVMHTLEEQIEATTRSLEAMERLTVHLQRVTNLLQEAGVMPDTSRAVSRLIMADSTSR